LNIVEKTVATEVQDRLVQQLQVAINAESILTPEEELQALMPVALDENDKVLSFREVERLPEYPGGMVAFMKWLTKNLRYPASAQSQQIKGRVVAQFIINRDGSITDLELTEHLNRACDNEVMRVLRMMPKWQPGLMNAKPCRTKVCIPVVFNM
jgi:protein TonB